jgi:hypothetical protein
VVFNKDLFVKRGGLRVLSRPAAAMALYTCSNLHLPAVPGIALLCAAADPL